MKIEIHEDELCAILVYGVVPELMPHCAFRREKHYKTADKKEIKCPHCGELFTIVDKTEKLELICYPKTAKIDWHTAMRCRFCHNAVGIIYMSGATA